jgi:hypothetical protein
MNNYSVAGSCISSNTIILLGNIIVLNIELTNNRILDESLIL